MRTFSAAWLPSFGWRTGGKTGVPAANQVIQPPCFPVLSLEEVEDRQLIVLWAPGGQNRPYKVPAAVTAKHKVWHHYIRRYSSTVQAATAASASS